MSVLALEHHSSYEMYGKKNEVIILQSFAISPSFDP